MTLEYERDPVVGDRFTVTALGFDGPARLRLFIDDRLLADRECPDPPCHEAILIPVGSGGHRLRVVASDRRGSEEELTLTIREWRDESVLAGR